MDAKRAVITPHPETSDHSGEGESHDTLPPSANRRMAVEPDETAGLVTVLYHAQQALLTSAQFIDAARDANDEELARFLEDAQRENFARVSKAKRVLGVRLNGENYETHGPRHDTPQGRVHYASVPDDAP